MNIYESRYFNSLNFPPSHLYNLNFKFLCPRVDSSNKISSRNILIYYLLMLIKFKNYYSILKINK